MLTVWRLVTARFADSAFSGEGARLYGGRWNRKGVPMVYTAATQSLAMLEMLVQDEPLRARYVAIPAKIPSGLRIDRVVVDELPGDWRSPAARQHLQDLGSDWAKRNSAAVLAVPSALIPSETNYLLNPLHPSFARIAIGEAQEFITDLRLERNS
ncbi:RES family NAD+ phosphorylase [Aromatoleum toluclasticum]|uniref:RES family NAD+ phosphorylase n=1 Tax=Aromatoleum toluclasticum TaxID=92003 RepID=UPI000370DCFE|nr:RES family NAD+ phosphorylase [Aromatoleum toluclasticum]